MNPDEVRRIGGFNRSGAFFNSFEAPGQIGRVTTDRGLRTWPRPSNEWAYLDYQGGSILMRAETVIEQRYRLRACEKEPWTAAWLDTIGPGDLLFNIGACVGSYALIAAHRGARVVAVEASPINAARLAENAGANHLGPLITLVLGVCGSAAVSQLIVPGQMVGAADVKVEDIHMADPAIFLPGATLDELAEVYGQPSHLLIDVDGGELDVLRGGTEALKGVREVMIEMSRDERVSMGCVGALVGAGLALADSWDERNGVPIAEVIYGLYRR